MERKQICPKKSKRNSEPMVGQHSLDPSCWLVEQRPTTANQVVHLAAARLLQQDAQLGWPVSVFFGDLPIRDVGALSGTRWQIYGWAQRGKTQRDASRS